MANPTAMTGGLPGVFTCTDAVAYCTVDPDRIYTFKHDGENAAGAASTDIIYLAFNGIAPDPDGSEGANKSKLCSGDVVAIGPGLTSFGFDMAATDAATMTVIPSVRVDVGAGATPDGIRATTSGTEELTAEFSELTGATAVHLAAGPARALLTGGLVIAGVPVAETAGDIAAPWLNPYRQLVDASHDLAVAASSVSDVAPAQMQAATVTDWAALAAAGDLTPWRDRRDYENHTIVYDITIGTLASMGLIVWGSLDGVLRFPIAAWTVLAAGVLEDAIEISGVQVNYIQCELDAENGAADGSVVFQMGNGN